MNALLGLIGKPLEHSRSPEWWQDKFRHERWRNAEYQLFPLDSIDQLPLFLQQHPKLLGFNVTIPFKKSIIRFLDVLDPVAHEIGAVNTVIVDRFNDAIRLKGFNTDAAGFLQSDDFTHFNHALILGTGGVARAIGYALTNNGKRVVFVSRKERIEGIKEIQGIKGIQGIIGYEDIGKEVMKQHTLIINATPVGMYPHMERSPEIPYHLITPDHFLYDTIYNPSETLFLQKGKMMGARIQSGEAMLHQQAELAFRIFSVHLRCEPPQS